MEEQSVVPSKVLHIRNLPPEATERELSALGSPFGQVINVLLLKTKNQGFIELNDTTAASRMVNYYATMPATMRYLWYDFKGINSTNNNIETEMCIFSILNIRN